MKDRAYSMRTTSPDELGELRATLVFRVLRVVAVAGLPVVAFSLYDVIRAGVLWMVPVVGLAYGVVLLTAFGNVGYAWRAWTFPLAMLLLGTVDLAAYGWAEDTRVLFLGGLVFGAIFLTRRAAYGLLGGYGLILFVFILARVTGTFAPLIGRAGAPPVSSLFVGWALFCAIGAAAVASLHTLLARLSNALIQRRQTAGLLKEERAELRDRTVRLEEANEALTERTRYFETATSIAASVSTILELDPLVNRAVMLIATSFELDHVGLYLIDAAGEWAHLAASSSEVGRRYVKDGYRVRRGDGGLIAWVLNHRETRTLRADEAGHGVEDAPAILPDMESGLLMPLMVGDQIFGVLDLRDGDGDRFGEFEKPALGSLARQLAMDIANARRLGDEARALEIAGPFYRTAQQLATARSDREVYTIILEPLSEFGADRMLLIRLEPLDDQLTVVADLRQDQVDLTRQDLESLDARSLADIVILGMALEAPIWVEDMDAAEDTYSPELTAVIFNLAEETQAAAAAFVPLRVEDEVRGGLLALHDLPHAFTPLEQRLYQLMGELGGSALERSELVREAEVRLSQEQLLSQVGSRLRASLDPDVVMRTAVEELGRVLDVELAEIEVGDFKAADMDDVDTQTKMGPGYE